MKSKMKVNIFFDDETIADVMDIPENVDDVEKLQMDFLEWLFDKSNDHEYWRQIQGEKVYCEYGVDAFVEWLNQYVLKECRRKAEVVQRDCSEFFDEDLSLYF